MKNFWPLLWGHPVKNDWRLRIKGATSQHAVSLFLALNSKFIEILTTFVSLLACFCRLFMRMCRQRTHSQSVCQMTMFNHLSPFTSLTVFTGIQQGDCVICNFQWWPLICACEGWNLDRDFIGHINTFKPWKCWKLCVQSTDMETDYICVCNFGADIYYCLLVSMKYADRAKRVRDSSFFPKSLEVCLMVKFS